MDHGGQSCPSPDIAASLPVAIPFLFYSTYSYQVTPGYSRYPTSFLCTILFTLFSFFSLFIPCTEELILSIAHLMGHQHFEAYRNLQASQLQYLAAIVRSFSRLASRPRYSRNVCRAHAPPPSSSRLPPAPALRFGITAFWIVLGGLGSTWQVGASRGRPERVHPRG